MTTPISDLKSNAIASLLEGDYALARDLFAEIHEQDPADIRSFVKLAEMKEKAGDVEGAINDFIEIASTYAKQDLIVQAIAINKIILRLDPDRADVEQRLHELSRERDEDLVIAMDVACSPDEPASPSGSGKIRPGLADTPLFSGLCREELNALIDSLTLKSFSAGDVIYEQGGEGECLFLIGTGTVCQQTRLKNGNARIDARLREGDFFGEHAFMSHYRHSNSAIAETDADILMIDRATFDQWVAKHPRILEVVESFYRQRVLTWILAMTPLFKDVPDQIRLALANKFNVRSFARGEAIVREGERGDAFYLIRSGSVAVVASKIDAKGGQVELGRLSEGSFFGEISLLSGKPRTATVIADQNVELMELTRENFDAIATDFPSVRKVVELYRNQRAKRTIKAML